MSKVTISMHHTVLKPQVNSVLSHTFYFCLNLHASCVVTVSCRTFISPRINEIKEEKLMLCRVPEVGLLETL